MEILPNEYRQLELTKNEKLFVNYAGRASSNFGMLLLKINPTMTKNDYVHAVIVEGGVVLCRFLPATREMAAAFPMMIRAFYSSVYATTVDIIGKKLMGNKSLLNEDGTLALRVSVLSIFPELARADVDLSECPDEIVAYVDEHCMFSDSFSSLRTDFEETMTKFLGFPSIPCAGSAMIVKSNNVNSVLQRIAPEYTTVRFALATEENSTPGATEELLVVDESDIAVRAYRLEPEQINIVNKMTKGDQLILACAGSGKSVLLIAKCFKAARMNPDKKFLITCFNRNLQSLYTWFIERAGLRERNVECCTFDALCRRLLVRNKLISNYTIEKRRLAVMHALAEGKVKDRYYGIFIDEVQMFDTDWYKFCYNLLENKSSEDHLFIICGDKTQELKRKQHNGKAPWNAGEGYPVYRGGNKSIRIEKNFRNCIEINDYINRFAQNARALVAKADPDEEYDPDMFLRGQAFRHGYDVVIKQRQMTAREEADEAVRSIVQIHDEYGIPYDEIAIAFYNRRYSPLHYYIESALQSALKTADIPYNTMYASEETWAGRYGDGGVSMITFDSVLGLDFQAVIVCGLVPLGVHDHTKHLSLDMPVGKEEAESIKSNISYLYVACTRAKDHLHIILAEKDDKSIYQKLLMDSI